MVTVKRSFRDQSRSLATSLTTSKKAPQYRTPVERVR